MSPNYINLNRSFLQIPTDQKSDEDDYDFTSYNGHFSEIKKWDDILLHKRVIILAEAGAGKTAEIKAITKKLRKSGKTSFFLRLEFLADSDFESSFEIGTKEEFNEWLTGTEPCWFFLDSVDEAKLFASKKIEYGYNLFRNKMGVANLHRAHIFITSRISEWRAFADLALIEEKLPFNQTNSDNSTQIQDCDFDHYETSELSSSSVEKKTETLIYVLQSLVQEQIKIFVRANGVDGSDEFLDAVERADAGIFCTRPLDLLDLINHWKKHGKIANPKELIESNVKFKLSEWDRDRESRISLSYDDAREGAELLALVVVFFKKTRIHFPEQGTDIKDSIDVQKVLKGWDYKKCSVLLQRPIFDEAVYGTVRFHHRSVYEYLAACKIAKLLANANSIRKMEELFFTERYGQQVVVKSMRPILTWLVLFNDRIKDKTMKFAPEIFLQGGDPTALPVELRSSILNEFCKKHENEHHWINSFYSDPFAGLHRFAQPDLAATIKESLVLYSGNEEMVSFLLKMIWKGNIQGCTDEAMKFAISNNAEKNTRLYAIRTIASSPDYELKIQLVSTLVNDSACVNGKVIGALISFFAPGILGVDRIVDLIKRVEIEGRLADDWLFEGLKDFTKNKCSVEDLNIWLEHLLALLSQSPLIDHHNCAVSKRYYWLIPYAIFAAERLIILKHPDALNENVLKCISFAQSELHFSAVDSTKHEFEKLVPEWPELNRQLFWYDVKELRKNFNKKRKTSLNAFYQVYSRVHYWHFTAEHFDSFLKEISSQTLLDDKSVALTLCIHLYRQCGKNRSWRVKLQKVVTGISDLELTLKNYLNPSPMPIDVKKNRRTDTYYRRKKKIREEKENEKLQKFKVWLKEHIHVLRDNSVASNKLVWQASLYLMHQLETNRPSKQRSQSNWQDLIPGFGNDVAEAFRDGCIDYWRRYSPEIRSETKGDSSFTPSAVVYGLCGLEMEYHFNSAWPNYLSDDEARLACRYAVNEINGFPAWIQKLYSVFPKIVNGTLLKEIEWEFKRYSGEQPCYHVLMYIASRYDWLKPIIANQVILFLKLYSPKHDDTLKNAFEIVLSLPDLKNTPFIEIAREKFEASLTPSRTALWLGTLMCIDADSALDLLSSKLDNFPTKQDATEFAMLFIVALFYWKKKRDVNLDYQRVEILLPLIKLMHKHIRFSEDINHIGNGVYNVVLRDNAQDARRYLLEILRSIPGKATYWALVDLSESDPEEKTRYLYAMYAKQKAEEDAELAPWQIDNITEFLNEIECTPKNHRELFELSKYSLFDLKDDLEQGDASLSALLSLEKDETKYRNFIGGWLRERSKGKYSVPQEEELADGKKPDLRIHGNGFDAPVPIELKIADNNWTVTSLKERLENQLCGDYLRDPRSNCGIFLVIYRGEKGSWEHPVTKENLNFAELLEILKEKANMIVASSSKIEAIEVIGIDLTLRTKRNVNA